MPDDVVTQVVFLRHHSGFYSNNSMIPFVSGLSGLPQVNMQNCPNPTYIMIHYGHVYIICLGEEPLKNNDSLSLTLTVEVFVSECIHIS